MSAPRRVRAGVRVRGRVQGVWFRESTRRRAEALGVVGFVRNCPDGSVEAVLEGDEPAVQAAVAYMQSGPPAAQVEACDVVWDEPRAEFHAFRVLGR